MPFTITTPSASIQLDTERTGEVAYTVFNTSGQSIVGRSLIQAPEDAGEAAQSWFTIVGEHERAFPPEGAEHFSVQIAVPPDVPAGTYMFRFDMVDVENINERHVAGPDVSLEVPEQVEEAPRCQWCIPVAIAAALVLLAGGVLAFIFWNGDDGVEIPDVRGLTEEAATTDLADACDPAPCFNVIPQEAASDTVEEGLVIDTEPRSGEIVDPGSEVRLFVSSGPIDILIPNFTGRTGDEAVALLEEACEPAPCFDVAVVEEPSETVQEGDVIDTEPEAGASALPGDEVTVFVSAGSEETGLEVPDVRGQPRDSALEQLEELGFSVDETQESSSTVPAGMVIRTSPSGGRLVDPSDAAVTIVVSLGTIPTDDVPISDDFPGFDDVPIVDDIPIVDSDQFIP